MSELLPRLRGRDRLVWARQYIGGVRRAVSESKRSTPGLSDTSREHNGSRKSAGEVIGEGLILTNAA